MGVYLVFHAGRAGLVIPGVAVTRASGAVGVSPAGNAGTRVRRRAGLAGSTFAAGIGGRTSTVTRFVGHVTIGIASTRGADTAGVGRGTSVVTGNRRRTAIRVGFTGGTLRTTVVRRTAIGAGLVGNVTVGIGLAGSTTVTGVVSGTAIGTAHGRNRTFRANGTAVVVTAAGGSRYFIFSRTVGRIVFELGFAYTLVIFTLTGSS